MTSQVATSPIKTQYGLMNLKGIIEKTRTHEGKIYTSVVCPAPDLYSKPSSFQISSKERFGEVGEEFNIQVRCSGYLKPNSFIDRNTGEQKKYENAHVFFDLVA